MKELEKLNILRVNKTDHNNVLFLHTDIAIQIVNKQKNKATGVDGVKAEVMKHNSVKFFIQQLHQLH